MKTKLLPICIFLFSVFYSFAQNNFPKGSLLLGGSVGFSTGKTERTSLEKTRYTNFSISPAAGFAVKENLFVGLSLGYMYAKNLGYTSAPVFDDSSKLTSYSYGVFVRKYKPLKYGFSVFLQGDLAGMSSKYETDVSGNYQTASNTQSVTATLTPGISYGINSRLQLEAGLNNIVSIGYSQIKEADVFPSSPGGKQTGFYASTSLSNFSSQLFFGFRFLLQKKTT